MAASRPQTRRARVTDLVVAETPERLRRRDLQASLEALRDAIATLDCEVETLRGELAAFEARYRQRVADEDAALGRSRALIRHLERWVELLEEEPGEAISARATRLERQRAREAERLQREAERPVGDDPVALEEPCPDDRLRAAFRRLVKRFHPDLARTEEEQRRFGALMTRINSLYRGADLPGLRALEEQAKGGELDDPEASLDAQLRELEERLQWFQTVLRNLEEERAALERTSTHRLWRSVQAAAARGEDLVAELKAALARRVDDSHAEIVQAIRLLEAEVKRHNRDLSAPRDGKAGGRALDRTFDPYAGKRLVRLSLEELAAVAVGPAALRRARWLEELASEQPAQLRLLLLAHVSELSPFGVAGLETFDGLKLRFDALGKRDETPAPLERVLGELCHVVEYGVRRATPTLARLGLRFRDELLREGLPAALRASAVRRELRRVLQVLGDPWRCTACRAQVFTLPLYRTRGLDNLRALVCPRCGAIEQSYFLPKGEDVQAVLNAAYLDLELVSEWSFRLARATVGIQLVPSQVERLTVGELKRRFCEDLLERHELPLRRGQVQLFQGRAKCSLGTPLAELAEQRFTVRLVEDAPITEVDAVEMLRYRIRRRFRREA
ncbi:MAG: hypothetical protein IT371_21475 [Deltaproteobacteria bacterium]|nr:hypothetical protein [Deltaproteobacteria bacterium]